MLKTDRFLAPIIAGLLLGSSVGDTDANAMLRAVKITDVRAYLYYHDHGEFDGRDALATQLALRNVMFGAGDAKGRSRAILIMADLDLGVSEQVAGKPSPILRVDISGSDRLQYMRKVDLAWLDYERGEIAVPIIAYDSGCEALRITLSLMIGAQIVSERKSTLEFFCGE